MNSTDGVVLDIVFVRSPPPSDAHCRTLVSVDDSAWTLCCGFSDLSPCLQGLSHGQLLACTCVHMYKQTWASPSVRTPTSPHLS